MMKIVIMLNPRTKKNSPRLIPNAKFVKLLPSKAFEQYQKDAGWFLFNARGANIDYPVNVQCVYFMRTRGRVDLCNLLESSCDILVHYGVLKDDNCQIVVGHDGSRVLYDKNNPRVEITIERVSR